MISLDYQINRNNFFLDLYPESSSTDFHIIFIFFLILGLISLGLFCASIQAIRQLIYHDISHVKVRIDTAPLIWKCYNLTIIQHIGRTLVISKHVFLIKLFHVSVIWLQFECSKMLRFVMRLYISRLPHCNSTRDCHVSFTFCTLQNSAITSYHDVININI